MGSVVGSIFGNSQADAAESAANTQASATKQAAKLQAQTAEKQIDYLKESRDIARGDLQPFREAGQTALPGLTDLVTNPQAQSDFINNNPFFDTLANKSTQTLLQNSAARGKVGSGGTAESLQNSLVLLGSDLLNQSITQRQNLATMGSNAAAGQATASLNTGQAVSGALGTSAANQGDLLLQGANARAAGIIGSANAGVSALSNIVNTGVSLYGLSML